ncbi:MAG: IS200/IS605 family transposase [Bacteroidales bacterium]|nr:IS200/IS605 family transposase [Bacteroidales bacterium]
MPFVKVWIHSVWTTKKRESLINDAIRKELFDHIYQNAINKNILIDSINGYTEHVHCLFRLRNDQTISKVIQLIKGESSFWINHQKLLKTKFQWQDEYFAVSVNESQIDIVRNYINNQEEHHRKKTFNEEYNEFIRKYDFKVYSDNINL